MLLAKNTVDMDGRIVEAGICYKIHKINATTIDTIKPFMWSNENAANSCLM